MVCKVNNCHSGICITLAFYPNMFLIYSWC